MPDRYQGRTDPPFRTVSPGAKISYEVIDTVGSIRALGSPGAWYEWYWYNDRDVRADGSVQVHRLYSENPEYSPVNQRSRVWDELGRYTIVCTIHDGQAKDDVVFHTWVDPVETLLIPELNAAKTAGLLDAFATFAMIMRYVRTLKAVAAKCPPATERAKKEHKALLEHYDKYTLKLVDLIGESEGGQRFIINTVHIETASQRKSRLSIFVSRRPGSGMWVLVDWTNPLERGRTGVYTATGKDGEEAIKNLYKEWDSGNRYYDGTIRSVIPSPPLSDGGYSKQFETDGASTWDSVAKFFEWVALGASIIAGIVTLIAPIPGSQVVSAMIWTAIFSSTAAAVINIGQRHAEGFGNAKDDAFDALSIVANCFAATGAWAKGATVLAKNTQGQVIKAVLIGQVATDGVQGVLVAVDTAQQYDQIMNDQSLTPAERTGRLVELFKGAALTATMTYISIKGTKEDLDHLNLADRRGNTPAKKLASLGQEGAEVDLTGQPLVEGHTKDQKQVTHVEDQHARQHPENDASSGNAKPRPHVKAKTQFPAPPSPEARGMRSRDDAVFRRHAQKGEGRYVIVRDGNADGVQFIGSKYKSPEGKEFNTTAKAESMKAKTSREDPTKGLVAFHPDHERTYQMLAGEHPATTVEALRADPAEYKKRYDYFKDHKIKEKGYTLLGSEDHYLVLDSQGRAVHGDVDLHGVYDKKGRLQNSEEIRGEMNRDMGTELIQHGAHDEWTQRNNPEIAGGNAGPQPPCTVYTPDGNSYHLATREDMKKFYLEHGLDWNAAYGDYEKNVKKINID